MVDVGMGQHDRDQVGRRAVEHAERGEERRPVGGEAGIDQRQPLAVLDEVPVDDPVVEAADAVGDARAAHPRLARGALAGL
jgi:hypothetical protein